MPEGRDPDDELLTPREVAEACGVSAVTVGRWARTGVLKPFTTTPGGQRRYRRACVDAFLEGRPEIGPERRQLEDDAVRLYDQGWSIRQVAAKFDTNYGTMRRLLRRRTTLRCGGGPPTNLRP
ncbi:MAG: helix-turn-helix domain-containing protein [Actinoallomurus sp.]